MNIANHSPSERVDIAYSAQKQENETIDCDLIPAQHLDTLYNEYEIQSAASPHIVPILELPRAVHAQMPETPQHNLPQCTSRVLHGVRSECNPWTLERNNNAHNPTQTEPVLSTRDVESVKGASVQNSNSSALQVNSTDYVPPGWVYVPPGIEVELHRHTSPQRPSWPKYLRTPSHLRYRFYPQANAACETGNRNSAVAASNTRHPPTNAVHPNVVRNRSSDVSLLPCTSFNALSPMRQD